MALTPEHHRKLEAELQQVYERLLAVAEALATAAAANDSFELVHREATLAANQVDHLRKSLILVQKTILAQKWLRLSKFRVP